MMKNENTGYKLATRILLRKTVDGAVSEQIYYLGRYAGDRFMVLSPNELAALSTEAYNACVKDTKLYIMTREDVPDLDRAFDNLAVVEDRVMCPLPLRVNTVSVNARVVGEEIIVTYTASANVASDVTVGLESGGRNIIKLGKAQASGTVPAELHGKTVKTILYVGSEGVSFDKEFEYQIDPLVEIPRIPAKPINVLMIIASLEDGALVLKSTADHAPASDLQISLRISGQVMATFVHRKNVREETAAAPAALAGKTCAVVLDAVNGVAGAQQDQTYQYVLRVANVVVPELPKPIGFLQDFIPAGNEPLGTEILLADKRDNEKYRCIKAADGKWWMGDHLRYKNTGGSFCRPYSDNTDNVPVHGYLYDWQTALNSAPARWHVPSDDEWKALEKALGMPQNEVDQHGYRTGGGVCYKLIEGGSSGLNLKFSGFHTDGVFAQIDDSVVCWASSEFQSDTKYAWIRNMAVAGNHVFRYNMQKIYGFSVRCILGQNVNYIQPSAEWKADQLCFKLEAGNAVASDVYIRYYWGPNDADHSEVCIRKNNTLAEAYLSVNPSEIRLIQIVAVGDPRKDGENSDAEYIYQLRALSVVVPPPPLIDNHIRVTAYLAKNVPTVKIVADYVPATPVVVMLSGSGTVSRTLIAKEDVFAPTNGLTGRNCNITLNSVNGVVGATTDSTYRYILDVSKVDVPRPESVVQVHAINTVSPFDEDYSFWGLEVDDVIGRSGRLSNCYIRLRAERVSGFGGHGILKIQTTSDFTVGTMSDLGGNCTITRGVTSEIWIRFNVNSSEDIVEAKAMIDFGGGRVLHLLVTTLW